MRILWSLVVVGLLVPCAVRAQTSTTDGVQALVRGDYLTAVKILRPLAEAPTDPDPTAQFFLGMMYQSGRGVQRNIFRACGYYKSVAESGSPFTNQARALLDALLEASPGAIMACTTDGWTIVPAASFTLGPEHSFKIDESGVTVSYRGAVQHKSMQFDFPGLQLLPVRYTPLDVTRPIAARRHFIQFFSWVSDRVLGRGGRGGLLPTWTLQWTLYEVIGTDFEAVVNERSLAAIISARPPKSFDHESTIKVRVNANGEAEWVILKGPNTRSSVIPLKESR